MPAFLFSGPQEIDQIPSFMRHQLVLKGRHVAETESNGLEDIGVAQSLHHIVTKTGRRRLELLSDRPGFGRGLAVAHGAIDFEERFTLCQGCCTWGNGILQLGLPRDNLPSGDRHATSGRCQERGLVRLG